MSSPIERAFIATVKCLACGAAGMACDCWRKRPGHLTRDERVALIRLHAQRVDYLVQRCVKCGTLVPGSVYGSDPAGTKMVDSDCPDCSDGEAVSYRAFDVDGNELGWD